MYFNFGREPRTRGVNEATILVFFCLHLNQLHLGRVHAEMPKEYFTPKRG